MKVDMNKLTIFTHDINNTQPKRKTSVTTTAVLLVKKTKKCVAQM